MLQKNLSHGRTTGEHVLQKNFLMVGHVLQVDMSYWRHVLREDMSYRRTCLTGGIDML